MVCPREGKTYRSREITEYCKYYKQISVQPSSTGYRELLLLRSDAIKRTIAPRRHHVRLAR